MIPAENHLHYIEKFLDTYFSSPDSEKELREAACLELQFTESFLPPEGAEHLCGKCAALAVGFGMQESGMGYFVREEVFRKLSEQLPDQAEKLRALLEKWHPETGKPRSTFSGKSPTTASSANPTWASGSAG